MRQGCRKLIVRKLGVFLSVFFLVGQPGYAQTASHTIEFDIPPQSLAGALREFLQQAQIQLVYAPSDIADRQSPGVSGAHDPIEALGILTTGTGLVVERSNAGIVTIRVPAETGDVGVVERAMDVQQPGPVVEQVVVTAARRDNTLDDLPMSVSVLSAPELNARGARDFHDVANWLPTLQLDDASLVFSELHIRGIQNSGFGGTAVDFFFDGASIFTAGPDLSPALLDVERVEVIRGPQGTLYGESSLAGTVRYISVRPVLNEWRGSAEAKGWTVDSGDSSWSGSAVLNIPLVTDTLAARLGISYEDRGGFVDIYSADPVTQLPDQLIREDGNPVEREAYRAALEWRPSGRFGLYLTARRQSLEFLWEARETMLRLPPGGDTLVPTGEFEQTSTIARWLRPQYGDQDWVTLEAAFRFAGATLISESTWFDSDTGTSAEFLGVPPALFSAPDEQSNLSQEFRLVSPDDDRFEWLVGAYWRDQDYSLFSSFDIPDIGFSSSSASTERRTQGALYGNIMYRPAERWAIELGLRLFREEIDESRTIGTEIGGTHLPTETRSGSGTFDVAAPRVVVSFDVGDNKLLYASVAKGFRGGSTNTHPAVPPELINVDPDTNYAYEAGIKGHWFDGSLAGSVVVFYNDWDDIPVGVTQDINGTPIGAVVNGESANTTGLEVDLTWSVSDAFALTLTGHYMETEIDSTVRGVVGPSALPVEKGNELVLAPKYSVAITGSLYQPLTGEWDGYVRADLLARDGSFSLLSNAPVSESDSYQLGNLRIGVQSDHWDVSIFGHNIWNERAHFQQGGNFLSQYVGNANIVDGPRRIGLAIRYQY